jgi:hypothetical protein
MNGMSAIFAALQALHPTIIMSLLVAATATAMISTFLSHAVDKIFLFPQKISSSFFFFVLNSLFSLFHFLPFLLLLQLERLGTVVMVWFKRMSSASLPTQPVAIRNATSVQQELSVEMPMTLVMPPITAQEIPVVALIIQQGKRSHVHCFPERKITLSSSPIVQEFFVEELLTTLRHPRILQRSEHLVSFRSICPVSVSL